MRIVLKMKFNQIIRYTLLFFLLATVWITQSIPSMGQAYADHAYPFIASCLSSFSRFIPFSLGDLFITLSITGLLLYPIYARRKKSKWLKILRQEVEYLLWIYVWFYLAWGLNYSQKNFYQRTQTPYVAYSSTNFKEFAFNYIKKLNTFYLAPPTKINKEMVRREVTRIYTQIYDSVGINRPFISHPRVKTMMFSPLSSMMGITGYMGPFFCEFNLNKNLLPVDYPATYAHEMAHLWGIANEAEANFYAYEVCTRSNIPSIRFSGYFLIFNHVIRNAQQLLSKEDYEQLIKEIRPGIRKIAQDDYNHWMSLYNPLVGNVQNWIYDLYLKGNKIKSGRRNYSEVIGLLISWEEKTKIEKLRQIIKHKL